MNKLIIEKLKEKEIIDLATAEEWLSQKDGEIEGVLREAVNESKILSVLSEVLEMPFYENLKDKIPSFEYIEKVPREFSRRYNLIGLIASDGVIEIATSNPLDMQPVDELAFVLDRAISPVIAPQEEIRSLTNTAYEKKSTSIETMVGGLKDENFEGIAKEIERSEDLMDVVGRAPIVKMINTLLFEALKRRASDIHIQPFEDVVKVRYRVDGILYDVTDIPKEIQEAAISRVKVMGKMDIAERRLPQDGGCSFVASGREVDVRISSVPSVHGEKIVLRLQDKSTGIYELKRLGLQDADLRLINKLIHYPYGIILETGPTGCGKTTTLYGSLSKINSPGKNIITIEDPVEYQLRGITQIQVSVKKGLTFARGLRHIVRQDPDIIMVGEIRDIETADIAINAALTGHLVFSTLHTNDSAGAITRLLDLGVEPYLVASSLVAVIAQRLIRVICPHCKVEYTAKTEELGELNLALKDIPKGILWKGKGCEACMNTGCLGRTGIFEVLEVDEVVKKQIVEKKSSAEIKNSAIKRGELKTLRGDGIDKLLKGLTTTKEVIRVTQIDTS